MSVNKNGNLRPDGFSLSWTPSLPFVGQVGLGGTYYWNPGSDTAPRWTLTGMYGRGRDVWKLGPPLANFNAGLVFRRNGMTSADALGPGTSSNVSTVLPSVSVNTSIPVNNGIPQPTKNKVSSVEAGLSTSIGASRAFTDTATPRQVADFLIKHIFPPTDGSTWNDDMVRDSAAAAGAPGRNNVWEYGFPAPSTAQPLPRPQGGVATVGRAGQAPVRFVGSRSQDPLGDGMTGWGRSINTAGPPQPILDQSLPRQPGGLPGLMQDYLRNRYPVEQ